VIAAHGWNRLARAISSPCDPSLQQADKEWLVRIATFVVLSVSLLLFAPESRSAEDLVISSGSESAYYHTVARGLRAVLRSQYGTHLEIRSSAGSLENLTLLHDPASPVGIALAQADALKRYLDDHPEFASQHVVLADVGEECVFLITGKPKGIESLADLEAEGGRELAVGRLGSGAAITWEYMNRLEPSLRNTKPVDVEMVEALLGLRRTTGTSAIAAAMTVQRPRTLSAPVEILLDRRDDYQIVPIREGDIKPASLEGGRPVYTFETVSVGFGRDYRLSFDTICTRGLLIAAPAKVSEEQLKLLNEAMATSRGYIAPGTE
jgi:TRAP-type uncharacterized transport system substrate-binding protein